MFEIEKRLYKKGKRYLIGIDEVGRGPLAGDVVACAVCVDFSNLIEGVKDSKKLTEKKRKELAKIISEEAIDFAIAGASPEVIDKINILQATKVSMENALKELEEKLEKKGITPDGVLIDSVKIDTDLPHLSLDDGDNQCYSIACASILAKVYRDNLCIKWDKKYPGYGLARHKGYGTKAHREAIVELGPSPIHRKSFLKNLEKWRAETLERGAEGEEMAARFLENLGYKIIARNFRVKSGEVDIIALDEDVIAFVEVKLRKDKSYGTASEAVDEYKQKKIKSAAEHFYYEGEYKDYQPRFDVIEIYTKEDIINHYVNAFS